MRLANIIAFVLLVIGGLNWLCVGVFSFDCVAWLFGAQTAVLSRIVYILVGLSAIWLAIYACYARKIDFPRMDSTNNID